MIPQIKEFKSRASVKMQSKAFALLENVTKGGYLVAASARALTISVYTLWVYEYTFMHYIFLASDC
jgi:hypothetical protein